MRRHWRKGSNSSAAVSRQGTEFHHLPVQSSEFDGARPRHFGEPAPVVHRKNWLLLRRGQMRRPSIITGDLGRLDSPKLLPAELPSKSPPIRRIYWQFAWRHCWRIGLCKWLTSEGPHLPRTVLHRSPNHPPPCPTPLPQRLWVEGSGPALLNSYKKVNGRVRDQFG